MTNWVSPSSQKIFFVTSDIPMTNWVSPSSQKYFGGTMTNWVSPSSQKIFFVTSDIPMTNWVSPSSQKYFGQNTTSGHSNREIIFSFTIFDYWKSLKDAIFVAEISQITDLQDMC